MSLVVLIILLLMAFGLGVLFAHLLGDRDSGWPDGS